MKSLYFIEEFLIIAIIMSLVFGLAIPKSNDKKDKNRIIDNPLSDEQHYRDDNEEHNGHEHNPEYDHEAFLGEEEAQEFDQLTPEESKSRLAIIVDKIDVNKDGLITNEELKEWIHRSQKKYIIDDVNRQWKSHTSDDDKLTELSWDEYKKKTYSFLDEMDSNSVNDDSNTYKEMLKRDERRWTLADRNGDNALTKEEFIDFLHPEEAEHMRDVVVDETLEDIDKDKDGKVSVDEYISDMYAPDATGDQVPDWVLREKEQFHNYRDKNKDGFMDREEVREWIIPPDYDHSDAESKHLIHEADSNKDGKLTKDEILDSYDLFVGSQATDFGEALMRHEEF